ncbi:hypothetical protein KKB55_15290 [Myxococcota bacterium]|nr:hypothetical protein [Myxococcota bacterium]
MIENRVKGHLSLFARSIDEKSIIISSEIDVNRHEIIEEALELNGSTAELNATINTDTSEDGEFSLKITSIDFYQNKKEEELVFIADHTGPDISVNLSETSIEYNGWYSGEVYFLPTVVDQYSNNNRFECVAPLRLSESNDSCRLDTGIADDGLFQVSIKAYDDLENESTYDLNLKIDNTEPEIDYNSVHFIGLNQGVAIGSQVSGLVEVSFDLIEEGVGLGEIYINNELFDYSFSLNDQNRYTFNYQIDTSNYSDGEQSILFKVVDLIGNQDDFVINFRVNNTAPDIQTEFIPVENSGYIHNDHFISGLFTLKVTSINANEIYAVSTYNNSSQNVINMEYNEIHHFWTGAFNSRDYVNDGEISLSGNVSNEYNHSDFSMTYQIDNTPPSIDADISSENSVNDWFKDQVNLTSEIEDQLSGIKSIKILKIIGENEEIIDEIEYQNENQILIDEIIDVSNCDRQCLIKLIATDNVNNESIFTRQINVDNSAPTITSLEILPLNNDNVYYNNQTNTFHTKPEFLLNLNNIFDLESGVNSIEITANEQQISIFNDIEQHSSMLLPIDLSQFLNQNVIIFVSIKDHLLNSTEYAINVYIDASSPLCSVSIQHPENNESSEYENPANFSFEVPIKDAIVFSIICNDDSGDSYRLSYLNENQNEVIVDVPLNELFEINYDLENIADGQHQFNLRILDVMRNESSAQISYIVDQTPPYVEAHLDNNLLLPGEIFYIVPGISFLTFDIYDEIQLNPVLNDPFLRIIHVESGGIVYNNNLRGQFPGLHINLDNPGHYSITFTVQDHIGNESIYEYTILAYENAPDFMFLPSIVQNEADYIAIKNAQNEVVLERPANSEPIQLGDNSDHSTPIKIYKLQSTWGAGDPNLPILKFQIEEDNPLGGVGRLEVWYLVGRFEDGAHGMTSNIVCSGNHGGLSTARKINDNQFELTLNEEALGLRPMSDPSRAVPTKLVLFTCDSFATMTAYEFNLDIRLYPTPVLIEDLGFDGYNGANVPITSNTITYSSVVSALNGVSDQTSLLLGRFKFSKPINTQSVNIYFREMSNATMYGYVKYIPDENFSIQVESHQNECNFMSSHSEIAKLDINANGTYTINSCLSKPRPLYLSNSFYYTNLIGSNVSDLDVRVSDEEIIEVTSRLRDFTPNEIDIINDSTDWNSIQQTAVYTNYRYLWDYDKDTFCINQIGCYSGIWAGKLILYLSRITFNYHKTINYRLYIPCENQSCPHLYEVNKVKPANSSTRSLNR